MSAYLAQCACGRWPQAAAIEPAASGSPTADRGWVVVQHTCVCGRRERFAHDTQGRMDELDTKKQEAGW